MGALMLILFFWQLPSALYDQFFPEHLPANSPGWFA
jgi:hypothetical protein